MVNDRLDTVLRTAVRKYGFRKVSLALKEIEHTALTDRNVMRDADKNSNVVTKPRRSKPKPAAVEYVAKMKLPQDKKPIMIQVAERFQNRSFLFAVGDVRRFFQRYGISSPVLKSRTTAVPRLFKFIATMNVDDIRGILENGMFSGPTELGPIADAIRNSRREYLHTEPVQGATPGRNASS